MKSFLYKKYKYLETKNHELRYLFLEITRRCNLSCIHCGSDCSRDITMKEMTTESWISIIDYMVKLYNPIFVLTGGEPLVSNSLLHIVDHLSSCNARWGMVTNGILLTENKMNYFTEKGLESITLSVDGNKESHLYIRRHKKSWEYALRALNIIGNSTVNIKDVVTCVYPGNIDVLKETAELLLNNGITSWRLFRIFPKGAAASKPELILDFNQSHQLLNWIAQNRNYYKKMGLLISFSCEGYIPMKLDRKVRNEPFFCRSGINIASILSDGTITGCNNNGPDFYQGNLKYNDFNEVWNNKFLEYRDHGWMKCGICKDCKEWKSCLGGSIHLRNKNSEGPLFCYVKDA